MPQEAKESDSGSQGATSSARPCTVFRICRKGMSDYAGTLSDRTLFSDTGIHQAADLLLCPMMIPGRGWKASSLAQQFGEKRFWLWQQEGTAG